MRVLVLLVSFLASTVACGPGSGGAPGARTAPPSVPCEPDPCHVERCREGYGNECRVVALGLLSGITCPPDADAAREWFARACDAGDREGCAELGLMVYRGEGGNADLAQAREILARACAEPAWTQTQSEACLALASLLREGQGGPADEEAARVAEERSEVDPAVVAEDASDQPPLPPCP